MVFFFFQAEDGIRDLYVTEFRRVLFRSEQVFDAYVQPAVAASVIGGECTGDAQAGAEFTQWNGYIQGKHLELVRGEQIGRASCREKWRSMRWPEQGKQR